MAGRFAAPGYHSATAAFRLTVLEERYVAI
jgi:hypothetical protein